MSQPDKNLSDENAKPQIELKLNLRPAQNAPRKLPEEEIDLYGEFKYEFPVENFDEHGRKQINLPPIFKMVQDEAELTLTHRLSRWRDLFNWNIRFALLTTAATGFMFFKKHRYSEYMLLPLSALWYSSLYLYDRAYGNGLNRTNVEAFRILTKETKRIFHSDPKLAEILRSEFEENE